jgi:hypothetical protein
VVNRRWKVGGVVGAGWIWKQLHVVSDKNNTRLLNVSQDSEAAGQGVNRGLGVRAFWRSMCKIRRCMLFFVDACYLKDVLRYV